MWPDGNYGFSLTGSGQILGIWDAGRVRGEHQEFATNRVTQKDGATTNSNHATHVAGTMIAKGVKANAKGMAYQASLHAYDWNSDASEMADAAATGLRVSNHSYGFIRGWRYNYFNDGRWAWFGNPAVSQREDYRFGFYSSYTQEWDQIAENAPYYLIVKSAGNDRGEGPQSQPVEHWVWINGNWQLSNSVRDIDGGSSGYDCIGELGVAKNILTVGAVHDIPNGYSSPSDVVMSSFSGWGPTDDGRIKPDVVANGIELYSCIATGNAAYDTYSGTSMSAPNVSGSIGLLLQHHQNLYGSNPLRASTLKALIIHTADEAGSYEGPDYKFGWGLMNTLKAVQVMQKNYDRGGTHIYEFVLNQGSIVEYQVRSEGTEPLRATICWTDPAGTPPTVSLDPTVSMLVNDVDLRIIGPGGNTFYPYILDPANPSAPAATGDNIRDNVEQVHISSPIAGLYTIRISHKGTLSGGSQAVSLIITGNSDILVTVDQKLSDGSSVDSVGRWEGGPDFVDYRVPHTFPFAVGATEVLRAAQKIILHEKYHKWDISNTVVNHHEFIIKEKMRNISALFQTTKPSITLRNELISAPGREGGMIEFKDPWLIDYADPEYGNNKRNRGMDAPFKSRPSPFKPDYTTSYNGDVYQGVFLNQDPDETPVYYSLRAPQQQVIAFHGEDITWYFQGWAGDQVSFQHPSRNETAVVFQADGAQARALYKGHLASNRLAALGNNNQRKM